MLNGPRDYHQQKFMSFFKRASAAIESAAKSPRGCRDAISQAIDADRWAGQALSHLTAQTDSYVPPQPRGYPRWLRYKMAKKGRTSTLVRADRQKVPRARSKAVKAVNALQDRIVDVLDALFDRCVR